MGNYDGDVTIVLTSQSIPQEMAPDGVFNLGKQGKFRGIVLAVSRDTQTLMKGGIEGLINAIHFSPIWNKLGSVGNGQLTVTKFDDSILTGEIATHSINKLDGHTFSYKISFSVSLQTEPLEIEIMGAMAPPGQAFAAWGKALLAGDVDNYKKYASRELTELLPEYPNELAFGLEMQQSMFPHKIALLNSKIEGAKAVLTLMGSRAGNTIEGTVTMLLEEGQWKVYKQSWSSSEAMP